jgi:pimeloyl-ACP methyl ester carboxylesterase
VSGLRASDGVELHAEAHGAGIPLLLSCAFCTTCENWRPQVEPLVAAGARVILWDYRGHGRSQAPDDPEAYSFEQVLRDLGSVLDWAAPGEPALLGGLSFGGLCSLHFAHRYPERVRGLLLVDSGPGFKNPEALENWKKMVERTASFLETRGLRAFVEGKAGATSVGLRPSLPAARAAAAAICAQDPFALARFGRQVSGPVPSAIDALAEIHAPALVMVGEKDKPYLRAAEVMAARLPRAEKVVIPNAGHIANIEEADAFNAQVIRFLQQLSSS